MIKYRFCRILLTTPSRKGIASTHIKKGAKIMRFDYEIRRDLPRCIEVRIDKPFLDDSVEEIIGNNTPKSEQPDFVKEIYEIEGVKQVLVTRDYLLVRNDNLTWANSVLRILSVIEKYFLAKGETTEVYPYIPNSGGSKYDPYLDVDIDEEEEE